MALPEFVRRRAVSDLDAFCRRRDAGVPTAQMRLEYEFLGDGVTLVERRIPWPPGMEGQSWTRTPIARFGYDVESARWHIDQGIGPMPDLSSLLIQVDRDPTGIYWG